MKMCTVVTPFVNPLSRHNPEINRDEEIAGMHITINTIESCTNILDCITA